MGLRKRLKQAAGEVVDGGEISPTRPPAAGGLRRVSSRCQESIVQVLECRIDSPCSQAKGTHASLMPMKSNGAKPSSHGLIYDSAGAGTNKSVDQTLFDWIGQTHEPGKEQWF